MKGNGSSDEEKYKHGTVFKDTKETRIGVALKKRRGGCIVISKISEDSLFQGTEIRVGFEVVSINNVFMEGKPIQQSMDIVQEAEGTVTIVAKQREKDIVAQKNDPSV